MSEYLNKGSPVFIEGRLKLDSWEDKDGQKRSKLKVVCERMQMVGARGQGGRGRRRPRRVGETGQPVQPGGPAVGGDGGGPGGRDLLGRRHSVLRVCETIRESVRQ